MVIIEKVPFKTRVIIKVSKALQMSSKLARLQRAQALSEVTAKTEAAKRDALAASVVVKMTPEEARMAERIAAALASGEKSLTVTGKKQGMFTITVKKTHKYEGYSAVIRGHRMPKPDKVEIETLECEVDPSLPAHLKASIKAGVKVLVEKYDTGKTMSKIVTESSFYAGGRGGVDMVTKRVIEKVWAHKIVAVVPEDFPDATETVLTHVNPLKAFEEEDEDDMFAFLKNGAAAGGGGK